MNLPPPETMAAVAIVIFLAIGLHEYSHCKMADLAGDPTPSFYGRVTLNLTKHFELVGTIMILITSLTGLGIGWGKPAPMDPRKMRNPKWDFFAAVAAGPISNVLQAAVFAMLLRVAVMAHVPLVQGGFLLALLAFGVVINLSLCFFNLIPLGPLDGHWLFGTFLPDRLQIRWHMFNRNMGTPILIMLVLFGQFSGTSILSSLIEPPTYAVAKFFIGPKIYKQIFEHP